MAGIQRAAPAQDHTAGHQAAGPQAAGIAGPVAADAADDRFELFDLRVEVVAPEGVPIQCNARVGDWFEVRGELLHFPPGQPFSMYSLAALLPLLPAKQRPTHPNDWMSTDAEVACPDPHCPTRFRITRIGKRFFSHAQTTAVPLPAVGGGSA
jgi:uncharacterized repeat protein (TIGR04076 family)